VGFEPRTAPNISCVMNARFLALTWAAIFVSTSLASAQSQPAVLSPGGGSGAAVDAKGVRHFGREYAGKIEPWLADRITTFAPEYPYEDRSRYHQGRGFFLVSLDLNTGAVHDVTVMKSTGFATLDACAVAALRRWTWKPNKWREVLMPVTFTMAPPDPHGRPGPLPFRH
jgi:TonB family protein